MVRFRNELRSNINLINYINQAVAFSYTEKLPNKKYSASKHSQFSLKTEGNRVSNVLTY